MRSIEYSSVVDTRYYTGYVQRSCGGQALGGAHGMIVTRVPTDTDGGAIGRNDPIGETSRRTSVVGVTTRDPGAEAGLVNAPKLTTLSSPPTT